MREAWFYAIGVAGGGDPGVNAPGAGHGFCGIIDIRSGLVKSLPIILACLVRILVCAPCPAVSDGIHL